MQKLNNDSIIVRETIACPNIAWEDLTTNFTEDFKHFQLQVLVGIITRHVSNFQTILFVYWAFAQHCLSISVTLLLGSMLTLLTISILNSSSTKFSLNLRISSKASVFTLVYFSTLFWSSKVIPISSFFWRFIQCPVSVTCHCRGFGCRLKFQ